MKENENLINIIKAQFDAVKKKAKDDKYFKGKRDAYELQLSEDILQYKLGETLKAVRLKKQLTQEQLGDRLGVQKAQISKLEKNMQNATLSTIIKVFKSLDVDLKVSIELPNL